MHFTRETDKVPTGWFVQSGEPCWDSRGVLKVPACAVQCSSTIFLRLNITSFLLGYFWSICRRCCHHIIIVWPFQRQRMTPYPRGSYLRLFSFVKKCFSVFWMKKHEVGANCYSIELSFSFSISTSSCHLVWPKLKKGLSSTRFYSNTVATYIHMKLSGFLLPASKLSNHCILDFAAR